MLKTMRRGITRKRTQELVDTVRDKVPGIAFRTTLIAGHPGETEDDFEQLVEFVQHNKFERLGIFTYSHEEGTHSHTLTDDVPQDVKEERAAVIMEMQQEISANINRSRVGQTLKVLVDRKEGNHFIGRTEFDSPEVDNEVLISAEHYVRVGDFVHVHIDSAEEFDLYGTPVE
jgi:ribosomal protein S12 methylthiotransferase